MKRARTLGIAVIALIGLGVSACSSGGGGGGADKEFTYWSMWKQGEPQQIAIQKSIDAFSAKTGVKVNVQWAGRAVLAQVTTALNSGNGPALVDQDGPSLVAALGATNAAQDVSKILKGTGADGNARGSVIIPGIVDPFVDAAGKPIVVPYELTGQTIWYNAKVDPGLKSKP